VSFFSFSPALYINYLCTRSNDITLSFPTSARKRSWKLFNASLDLSPESLETHLGTFVPSQRHLRHIPARSWFRSRFRSRCRVTTTNTFHSSRPTPGNAAVLPSQSGAVQGSFPRECWYKRIPCDALPYVFLGQQRIGGCMRTGTFSCRNALKRQLDNGNVQCIDPPCTASQEE